MLLERDEPGSGSTYEVVRDLHLGRTPVVDVSALDVRRFDGEILKHELDII